MQLFVVWLLLLAGEVFGQCQQPPWHMRSDLGTFTCVGDVGHYNKTDVEVLEEYPDFFLNFTVHVNDGISS